MSILVSIDCITYNHEKYIADTIESFLMQKTDFKFEILIHDDASTDKTADIVRQYEKKYPNIVKPIYQTENQYSKGVKKINYKFNFTRAKGNYVAACEGDDYWTDPYKLQKQVEYMKNNVKCGMCFHAAELVDARSEKKIGIIKPYSKDMISSTEEIILGGGGFLATNSMLYRKEILDNPPSFYMNAHLGDYPLQIYFSTQKYAYYINEVMSAYRTNVEGSWTNRNFKGENRIEKYIKSYENSVFMLEEFNKESSFKYNDAVNKAVSKRKCQIILFKKDMSSLKNSEEYKYFKNLSLTKKIKLVLFAYYPDLYLRLVNVKQFLKLKFY